MEIPIKEQCWRLIKSLSKSEKRNFKLYANRQGGQEHKFVQLFDLIDAQTELNDEVLLLKVADGQPGKLSNLKRHLYQQILVSLRLVHINKQTDIQIRQHIDFARILYGKSHVMDALRMLDKAKAIAIKHNLDFLLSEILEFQKLIEARHVTRSRQVKNKMDDLVKESRVRAERNLYTSLQSNINIQIQGYYILNGHVRNQEQANEFAEFWKVNRRYAENYPATKSTFFEVANRHQASMWRFYILLELFRAKEAAADCYNLFRIETEMPIRDPDFFIRTIYYINAFAYLLDDEAEARRYKDKLEAFITERASYFNDNSKKSALIYLQLCKLNVLLIKRDWSTAKSLMLEQQANKMFAPGKLPSHRRNLFRYKFAAIYFGLGDFSAALDQLQSIMNSAANLLRDDLLINTRLMQAICYLETDNFYLADYSIANLSRIIRRNPYAGKVHDFTLGALRKMVKEEKGNWPSILQNLEASIQSVQTDPYEAKCLRFLDVPYWIAKRNELSL